MAGKWVGFTRVREGMLHNPRGHALRDLTSDSSVKIVNSVVQQESRLLLINFDSFME